MQDRFVENKNYGSISTISLRLCTSTLLLTPFHLLLFSKWKLLQPNSEVVVKIAQNSTQAILYHPKVLNLFKCSDLKTKAKLSFLVAIDHTTDQLIKELKPRLSVPTIQNGIDITLQCISILASAKESVASLPLIKRLVRMSLTSQPHNTGMNT